MTIDCNLTVEDIVAFNLHCYEHTPALRRRRLLTEYAVPSMMALAAAYAFLDELKKGTDAVAAGVPAAVVLILAVLLLLFMKWSSRRNIIKTVRLLFKGGGNRAAVGPRSFVITNDGVAELTGVSRQESNWAGIEKIANDGDYIYIYNTAASAFIIPRRSITNGADFDEAWRLIQDCRSRHSASPDRQCHL